MPAVVLFAPVVLLIVPPVAFPPTLVLVPSPVTVSPPLVPVPFRTMPFAGPEPADVPLPALIDRNLSPVEPIVVLATLRAVPVVVVSVLTTPVSSTVTVPAAVVPPLIALNAVFDPVDNTTPPENVTAPLSLL